MAYTVPYLCALLPFPAPSQAINALTSSSASSISPLRHRTNHTSHSFKTLQDEAAATPSHLLGFCGRKCFRLQDSYVAFIHTPAPRPAGVRGAGIKISFSADHLSKFSCGFMRKHEDMSSLQREAQNSSYASGSAEVVGPKVPTQAQSVVEGSGTVLVSEYKPIPDIDYLQELLAIQQQGPRAIGFFGTRNMGFMHQQLIEILSYAMVITKNHIYTSGASGTNAAVIRGALRAEKPELLTVILPQSLQKQPPESQELLAKVKNLFEKPQNDHLPLLEASRLCNKDILSHVQQVICFAFHDSRLLMETCQEAKNLRKIVTLFYLD